MRKGKGNMSKENKENTLNKEKIAVMAKIQKAEMVYGILSVGTRMPYVICDPDTYDDEILLFLDMERAQAKAKALRTQGEPVQILKIDSKHLLLFFSNLYTMGVNCIVVNEGDADETRFQLQEIVHRAADEELPEGKVRIENPQFHLTALYFMQKMMRAEKTENETELQELREEAMAHFKKGRYIVAFEEGKGAPVLTAKNGDKYQPIFTDILEFQKFNQGKKFRTAVIEADKVVQIIPKEAKGIAVNPFGVNLRLQMNRKEE